MKTILLICHIIILLSASLAVNSQQDEKAGKIIERFVETINSSPSVSVTFTISIASDNFSDEFDGQMVLKGEKYRLEVMGTETWFDGTTTYTYMPEANEVMISEPDVEEEGLISNPTRIFSLYHDEFNYRLIGETIHEGKNLYELELHPQKPDLNFQKVHLFIDMADNFLHSAMVAGNDGNVYTFQVNGFDTTKKVSESYFTFNKADYPGVEEIDMRW